MKFQPTSEELSSAHFHARNAPSDLNADHLHVSGSNWSEAHLTALRVVVLNKVDDSRLYPSEYWPSESNKVLGALVEDLTAATEDDLKKFFRTQVKNRFNKNKFKVTFALLAEAMATRPALIPGTEGLRRSPSSLSDLSASSDEDKDEESSEQALSHFFITILENPRYSMISAGGMDFDLNMHVSHRKMNIHLGNVSKAVAVENDGGIYLTRQGAFTGSNRFRKVPLLSLDAKRRHAGGIHRGSGKEEAYNADIIAQEVGKLLGQAVEHAKQLGAEADQEAFVCSIHGTLVTLVAARFTASYLASLRTQHIPLTETLYVRRSKAYNFKTQEGRVAGLKLCIGLLEYIRSGHAEIGLLQKVFELNDE